MESNIYNRQDYGGYWRRGFGDGLDGIFLGILFAIFSAAPESVASILGILTFLAYMIGFKAYGGNATPGYGILGMKIVAINGGEVSVKQIIIRLISSAFSAAVFGLGFIWIAFDKNKQAWHDKVAGTYVIKSGAKPVGTVEIPGRSLVRWKLFAFQIGAPSAALIALIFLLSAVSQEEKQYINENPWIRQEIGTVVKIGRFSIIPKSEVPSEVLVDQSPGASWSSVNHRRVTGTRGQIDVVIEKEKRGERWVIVQAGFTNKEGKYIDISKPFVIENTEEIIPE